MYHKLIVVATPIGNLKEISELAKSSLADAKLIICEDTKVTRKLLQLLGIYHHQKLVSYHKMNDNEKTDMLLEHLKKHECVLVSDAGYPVISDPGFLLIKRLREHKSEVQVINGPCALIHAVVGSGIDCHKFFFANFLTKKTAQRLQELRVLKGVNTLSTIVYYESLNFMLKGLELLKKVFGDIEIGIARELSKMNETFYCGKISELITSLELRGEFVVLIPRQKEVIIDDLEILMAELNKCLKENIPLKKACNLLANKKFPASVLYKMFIQRKK